MKYTDNLWCNIINSNCIEKIWQSFAGFNYQELSGKLRGYYGQYESVTYSSCYMVHITICVCDFFSLGNRVGSKGFLFKPFREICQYMWS